MREFRTYGSVRGALSNGRPYRVHVAAWNPGRCGRGAGFRSCATPVRSRGRSALHDATRIEAEIDFDLCFAER